MYYYVTSTEVHVWKQIALTPFRQRPSLPREAAEAYTEDACVNGALFRVYI